MARPLVRNLTLASLGLLIVGIILLVASFAGSTISPSSVDVNGNTVPGTVTGNNGALFGLGLLLIFGGSIVHLVAYIGALIKTAQLQRWAWFVIVLLLSPIALLVYAFAGPDAPATPAYPGYPQGYMPPQGPYGPQGQPYPPQQYPPQYPSQQYPPQQYPPQPPYQQPPQQQ
jgi:hypothetical protein